MAAIKGVVTTLAGSGAAAFADGTGAAAIFWNPYGVAYDPTTGNIVVADAGNNRIRLVTPLGVVTTLAGSGSYSYLDGTGAAASFASPSGVAVIPSTGVIVVADTFNHRIRLVTPAGVVTTLAGNGLGYADGTGTAASFRYPSGVAVIPSTESIVVADRSNHRIRLVTSAGVVTTLAGPTTAGSGTGTFADGTGAAARFNYPWGVAVIPSTGVIVVADAYNHRIRLVTSAGVVTTLAGSGSGYVDGTGTAASFSFPYGVAVIPSSGTIVVADYANNRIRLVTSAGVVTTLAGSGTGTFADGTGTAASFTNPWGVAVIPSTESIVVADAGNHRIRLIT